MLVKLPPMRTLDSKTTAALPHFPLSLCQSYSQQAAISTEYVWFSAAILLFFYIILAFK